MDAQTPFSKAVADAVRYSVRVTPFVLAWLAFSVIRSYRMRGALSEAKHENVMPLALGGLALIAVVFLVTLALRLAGLRGTEELSDIEASRTFRRERLLRRAMWLLAAAAMIGLFFSVQ